MKFQHAYSEPFRGSDLDCQDPSLAQQQFKDDADINVLLERFKITGVMPQSVVLPSYGDFSGISDYRSAQEAILKARNAFMDLPAAVRAEFHNDPQELLEFVSDPKNRDKAVALGLMGSGALPQVNVAAAVAPSGEPKPDAT